MTIAEIAPSHTGSRTRTVFRAVAIAEALSWAVLLIAMGFKWLPEPNNDQAVRIPGMIHGGIFILYVISCLVAARSFGWNLKTLFLALASSIPPFFTYVFEALADKRGLLGRKSA